VIAAAEEMCPEQTCLKVLAFRQEQLLKMWKSLGGIAVVKIPGKLFHVGFPWVLDESTDATVTV